MVFYVNEQGMRQVSQGLIIGVAISVLVVIVAFFVLRGLGLYKLAKKHNVKLAVLAWFPFTWIYIAALLIGDVALFGKRFSKFALTVFIVFTVAQVFYLTINLLEYIPVVGFYLQNGSVYVSTRSSYIDGICNYSVGTSFGYIGCEGMNIPYSAGVIKALRIFVYFGSIFNLVSLFAEILVYSNFFRSYLPNHYFIATIFSIFGFFGPFAFAVRNNDKVNYAEYIRARYAAFYGAGRGYGNNGYGEGNDYNGGQNAQNDGSDPFEESSDQNNGSDKTGGGSNDDPFGEFSDKK